MTNPLASLVVDAWYKAFAALGAVVLLLSLTIETRGVPNHVVQLGSLGVLFVGLGEWINHPLQTTLIPPDEWRPAGRITGYPRNPSTLGRLFVLLGAVLLTLAGRHLFR